MRIPCFSLIDPSQITIAISKELAISQYNITIQNYANMSFLPIYTNENIINKKIKAFVVISAISN